MLAIVSSDKSYVSNLLDKFSYEKKESSKISSVYKCNYNNHEFLIVITGYGKVNIGSTLMYIKQKYNIKAILVIGTIGSISNVNIFDFIIPSGSLQFDVDFMPNGYNSAQLPGVNASVYYTNTDINECLFEICKDTNYFNGTIASSDMYVCNNSLANSIRMEYDAIGVDTESGSIGEFCYNNDISYSCLKVASNYAYNNSIKQYNMYDDNASLKCQEVTYNFIKAFYE